MCFDLLYLIPPLAAKFKFTVNVNMHRASVY